MSTDSCSRLNRKVAVGADQLGRWQNGTLKVVSVLRIETDVDVGIHIKSCCHAKLGAVSLEVE